MGNFMPHATVPKKKKGRKEVWKGGRCDRDRKRGEIGRTLEKYTE
jgi:hypothetical protein